MAKSKARKQRQSTESPKGLKAWCRRAGIGYSTFFTLPAELRPESTRNGRRVMPIEEPDVWLRRVAAAGGIPTSRAAA